MRGKPAPLSRGSKMRFLRLLGSTYSPTRLVNTRSRSLGPWLPWPPLWHARQSQRRNVVGSPDWIAVGAQRQRANFRANRKTPSALRIRIKASSSPSICGVASSNVKRFLQSQDSSFVPYIRPSYQQNTSIDGYVSKASVEQRHVFQKGTLYVSTMAKEATPSLTFQSSSSCLIAMSQF